MKNNGEGLSARTLKIYGVEKASNGGGNYST
jgi:hypothetical protein